MPEQSADTSAAPRRLDGPSPAEASGVDVPLPPYWGAARLAFYTPVVDQPTLADRKATFILTVTGLIATTLLFFLETLIAIISGPHRWIAHLLVTALACLVVLLVAAARFAYLAYVLPQPPHSAPSFFRNVGRISADEYIALLASLDHRAAIEAILHYNYSAAVQGAAKYRGVNQALNCMKFAIPLWMALLLIVAVWR